MFKSLDEYLRSVEREKSDRKRHFKHCLNMLAHAIRLGTNDEIETQVIALQAFKNELLGCNTDFLYEYLCSSDSLRESTILLILSMDTPVTAASLYKVKQLVAMGEHGPARHMDQLNADFITERIIATYKRQKKRR